MSSTAYWNLKEMASKFSKETTELFNLKTFFNENLDYCEELFRVAVRSKLEFPLDTAEQDSYHTTLKEIVKELSTLQSTVTSNIGSLRKEIIEPFDSIEKNYDISSKGFMQKMPVSYTHLTLPTICSV
eukprot:TRINITY_DN15355_c0_g1_i1.p1 TRINITY_DN15355_c0_g1~~TRINITY_DN15355_c0_g1_i1.p1  ORF type:complete len:128 (-),score=38.38 TRINITY_DN15355_c0_g1_i1:42-425(-)